jgi:Domain of unknown function (DUF6457)
MRRDEWLRDFCERAGVEPPGKEEVFALLDLAGSAAHASERTAAPLACWAAGRSELPLERLRQIAGEVAPVESD